jgi:hypothetical protein
MLAVYPCVMLHLSSTSPHVVTDEDCGPPQLVTLCLGVKMGRRIGFRLGLWWAGFEKNSVRGVAIEGMEEWPIEATHVRATSILNA